MQICIQCKQINVVLGLHFGHDAHACIFYDGTLLSYVHRERLTGIKHHAGIDIKTITTALQVAKLTVNDITHIAVTNTQYREFVFEDPDFFCFEYQVNNVDESIDKYYSSSSKSNKFIYTTEITDNIRNNHKDRLSRAHKFQYPDLSNFIDRDTATWKTIYKPYVLTQRQELKSLSASDRTRDSKLSELKKWCDSNIFIPIMCQLGKRRIPGFMVDHHYAHCCSSAAKTSPYRDSLIFSADGSGASILGNLAAVMVEGSVYPFLHTKFRGGQFYESAASLLDLDCGKFMGLSGYGKPSYDLINSLNKSQLFNLNPGSILHFLKQVRPGFALSKDKLLSKDNFDYAAACQAIFELQYLYIIRELKSLAEKFFHITINHIILSGGCALNCPSNSLLAENYGNSNIYIEPTCTDEGIAVGAAIAVMHIIKGQTLDVRLPVGGNLSSPYLGLELINNNNIDLRAFASSNSVEVLPLHKTDWPSWIAKRLLDGAIGFIAKGRSEVGPRALGNRSIIAYPKYLKLNDSVNDIKSRERWRPLAPAVLHSSFDKLYAGPKNPYMLMTNSIKLQSFPSTTHVDGSARVQCVYPENQNFYSILTALESITHEPEAILNTSFNRKNEAIINSLDVALDFFINSEASFILLDDYILSKKQSKIRDLSSIDCER